MTSIEALIAPAESNASSIESFPRREVSALASIYSESKTLETLSYSSNLPVTEMFSPPFRIFVTKMR